MEVIMPSVCRRLTTMFAVVLLTVWTSASIAGEFTFDEMMDLTETLSNIKSKPKAAPKLELPAKPAPSKVTKTARKSTAKLPARTEKRFIVDEILVETKKDISAAQLADLARRQRLTLIESAGIVLIDAAVHRFRIADGRSVRAAVAAVGTEPSVLLVQPNYTYALVGAAVATAEPAAATTEATPAPAPQYAADLLHLSGAHAISTGKTVRIGILDTAIVDPPGELADSVIERFDATGAPADGDDPSHGTAIAGIIAAHGQQVIGVAPSATLLSARAFVAAPGGSPSSNSFVLLKGLDWLAGKAAQIVNMSFAGPSDPLFLKEVQAARAKGILPVAAAGNDGPKAPPDFPAADPSAFGVTAIDQVEAVLATANRGVYIAVAAPGVDVLVISPDGSLVLSSGTSMAAAHVSGAAALLLEADSRLSPDDLSRLLSTTAVDLGKKGKDSTFGAGLINPQGALGKIPPAARN
jgi:subtilisin family serine protease